jgi:hypothetical protein
MASNAIPRDQGANTARFNQRVRLLASRAAGDPTLQALTRRMAEGNATVTDRRTLQAVMNQIDAQLGPPPPTQTEQQIEVLATNVAVNGTAVAASNTSSAPRTSNTRTVATADHQTAVVNSSTSRQRNARRAPSTTPHPLPNGTSSSYSPSEQDQQSAVSPTSNPSNTSPGDFSAWSGRYAAAGAGFSFSFGLEERPVIGSYPRRNR